MREQNKQKWPQRVAVGIVALVLVLIIGIFYRSMHPYNKVRADAENIATKSAQVTNINGFWWNTRDKSYLTVSGKRKNVPVYVVIAQKTGKVNVVLQESGTTRDQILQKVWSRFSPKRVLNAGLRFDKHRLVWDVGYVDKQNQLGYVTYDYHSGQMLKVISDL
ncbi:cell wall elongation regulator TseB-like domain-containing protein [Lacticaseibacillus zhaodongensis]|uniref:cell wall elongation regulator TseB-like domain-containing protein n=1 Tax=Lacticaseibacillus zhaodongensis TaxID=2668065 RepID=UPI0012D364B4|nr:DUF5590 domain-containing protein [Lacticaseibacillus zhaodongensis]